MQPLAKAPAYWNRGRTKSAVIPVAADYKPKHGRITDHTGKRFGRLVALRICGRIVNKKYPMCGALVWRCICDCGEHSDVPAQSLKDGSTKSCGCLYREGAYRTTPTNKLELGRSALNQFFANYSRSAKARGISFSLTKSDFSALTSANCHYCGSPPTRTYRVQKGTNGDFIGCGIDRLNNREGYVYRNCVSCCKQCNIAKGVLTMDDFAEWLLKAHNWARMYASLGHEPFNLSDSELQGWR